MEREDSLEKESEALCQPSLNILLFIIGLMYSESGRELVFCCKELRV